jgi:hypothetical protein
LIRSRLALPQYAIRIKIGKAEASKNSKKIKILVQVNAPNKKISIKRIIEQNKNMFTSEYQAVNKATISTAVDRITKGKLRACSLSNKVKSPI